MAYKLIDDMMAYKSELYFLELAKPLVIGSASIAPNTPLPIDYFRLKDQVVLEGAQSFSLLHFMEGMLKVLSMDKTFQYRSVYLAFLKETPTEILELCFQQALEYKEKKDFLHALMLFKGLLQLFEDDEKVLYLYGCTALDYALVTSEEDKQKHLEEVARLIFEKMVKEDVGRAYAYYQLGFIYNNQKAFEKALESFHNALALIFEDDIRDDILEQLGPLEDKKNHQLGLQAIADQDFRRALGLLLPLSERYDDWWMLFLAIGACYRQLEKFEESHFYLRKARAFNAEDLDVLMELALLHRQWGNLQEAKDLLAKALSNEPENLVLICEFVDLLFQMGEDELAKRFANHGLSIDGQHVFLHRLLEKNHEKE
jgi:tetratricopeptide (TPR) repeat protein